MSSRNPPYPDIGLLSFMQPFHLGHDVAFKIHFR